MQYVRIGMRINTETARSEVENDKDSRLPTTLLYTHLSFILRVLRVPSIHAPEDQASMYLSSRECNMQQRGGYFESQLPSVPEVPEKIHGHYCFNYGPSCRRQTREEEDSSQERVSIWVDTVQDNGDMGEEFGDDIESA